MNKQHKLVLLVSILASFVAFLDGSVVNVALPAIAREFGGGLSIQQWVVDAYLITLGSLMLVAGSFSDIFGRKRVLLTGLIGFLITSILCAVASNGISLIIARGLQGAAGALLVPSSLALIMSTFTGTGQGKAIGIWTAWTGIAFIVGPLLGGFLVDSVSWRLIFAVNVIPILVTVWLMRAIKQPEPSTEVTKVDITGAVLCVVALGALGYALIEQSRYGWHSPAIYGMLTLGLAAFAAFIWHEYRTTQPMLPLGLFKVRNFYAGNIATALIYGGLSIATFLIVVFVQQVGGYSAIEAGVALLPVTILMFFLSSRFGEWASAVGPRLFMTVGPIVGAFGFLSMLRVDGSLDYWTQLLPGILLFGLGLSITVAPLTAAILGAIDSRQAGIASAVNNAVARIAGLVAIAAIGVIVGPRLDLAGFHRGVLMMAGLLFVGGIISFIGIRTPKQSEAQAASARTS